MLTGGSAITDYVIERSTDGSTWVTVVDGTSTATSHTLTGLSHGDHLPVPRVGAQRGRRRSGDGAGVGDTAEGAFGAAVVGGGGGTCGWCRVW